MRLLDLFWTFTDSLYLTTFKLLFIGSSAYVIYLMLNDYKPTHDPNIDTFKVQYLLGISAVLAILFPRDYRISEVGCILSMVRKTTGLTSYRYSGLFPSGWSRLPYCHNYSCCNEPVKQTPSLPTICLLWDSIGHSTSRTGSSAISPKPPSNVPSNL